MICVSVLWFKQEQLKPTFRKYFFLLNRNSSTLKQVSLNKLIARCYKGQDSWIESHKQRTDGPSRSVSEDHFPWSPRLLMYSTSGLLKDNFGLKSKQPKTFHTKSEKPRRLSPKGPYRLTDSGMFFSGVAGNLKEFGWTPNECYY